MNKREYLQLDAVGMMKLIKSREIHPQELLDAAFKQLEAVNPALNAVIHNRKERAFQEIKRTEQLSHLPYYGIPLLLKDLGQSIEGEPITSGSRLLKENIAKLDSNFVKRLREAGFIFIGSTNTPEFGLKNITEPEIHGPTRNPWNHDYSAGGSSGGSAAAIASGIVPLAGASDGGGSIRIPSSFTNLFGLKPTRGKTPVGPGVGRQWQGASIDFVLSRSVRDSAAMLDLLQVVQPEAAFQTPRFPNSYQKYMEEPFPKMLKIGYTTESPVATPVSNEAKLAVEKVVRWLEKQGFIVEEQACPVDGIQLMKDYYIMNSGEMNATIRAMEKAIGRTLTPDDMEIESWVLHEAGKVVTAAEYSESLASWDRAAELMANFHRMYDLYITPTTAFPAPKVGELTNSPEKRLELQQGIKEAAKEEKQGVIWDMFLPSLTYTPFTQLANLTGQPAMSLPVHRTKDGLPLGVQAIAQKGQEHHLLQLAYQLEQTDLWIGMNGNPYFDGIY